MNTKNPLARLMALADARAESTETLTEAVRRLLAALSDVCEVGDEAVVGGYTLRLTEIRSNVGSDEGWTLTGDDCGTVWLERSIDSERWLHGDFHALQRGPSRGDLLAFAKNANGFVEALVGALEAEAKDMNEGASACNALAERVEAL